jgi:hypothetical protein
MLKWLTLRNLNCNGQSRHSDRHHVFQLQQLDNFFSRVIRDSSTGRYYSHQSLTLASRLIFGTKRPKSSLSRYFKYFQHDNEE